MKGSFRHSKRFSGSSHPPSHSSISTGGSSSSRMVFVLSLLLVCVGTLLLTHLWQEHYHHFRRDRYQHDRRRGTTPSPPPPLSSSSAAGSSLLEEDSSPHSKHSKATSSTEGRKRDPNLACPTRKENQRFVAHDALHSEGEGQESVFLKDARAWLLQQLKGEKRLLGQVLKEVQESRRSVRSTKAKEVAAPPHVRGGSSPLVSSTQQRRPSPPRATVACHCSGFSTMDQHDSWCASRSSPSVSSGGGGQQQQSAPSTSSEDQRLSSSHVCIINDVCIDRSLRLVMMPATAGRRQLNEKHRRRHNTQEFSDGSRTGPATGEDDDPTPSTTTSGGKKVRQSLTIPALNENDFSISYTNGVLLHAGVVTDEEEVRKYRQRLEPTYKYDDGTTVLLPHSAHRHITHFLEPLGSLSSAMRDLMRPDCDDADPRCFSFPKTILSTRADIGDPSFWGSHVLRGLLGEILSSVNPNSAHGSTSASVGSPENATSFQSLPKWRFPQSITRKCFSKLVIPSPFYGIWPLGESPSYFLDRLSPYWKNETTSATPLKHQQRLTAGYGDGDGGDFAAGSPAKVTARVQYGRHRVKSKAVQKTTADGDGATTAVRLPIRNILLARRSTKRKIVDWSNFESIVQEAAATVGATVRTVDFGSLSFAEQAAASEEAGIMMGIHGADLTNMIFQKTGSVVVEINPLFFFENRFYEMASALGHKYLPWNCGTHECAFGGDRAHFDRYIGERNLHYDATNRTLSVPGGGVATPSTRSGRSSTSPSLAVPFRWAWTGYVGFACPQCNTLVTSTSVRNGLYTDLRESSVKIGSGAHREEIQTILQLAFEELKWDRVTTRETPKSPSTKSLSPPVGETPQSRPLMHRRR